MRRHSVSRASLERARPVQPIATGSRARGLALAALALVCAGLAGCGNDPGKGPNQPPSPRIATPADGAVVRAGASLLLQGTASDPEDGVLSGASLAWSSDLQGALGSGASLTVSLGAGTHRVSLTATDSSGLSATAQVSVTAQAAQNTPPAPVIDAPADGASFDEGQPITLQGHATDAEDGPLPGSALSWNSSIDGAIGTGKSLVWSAPSRGTHQLLLTATDQDGASAYATATITVVPAGSNHPPVAAITAPHDGATFTVGTPITFTGSGTDAEDGPLGGAALAWTSSLDGALGTGGSLQRSNLSRGAHTISLTATDSLGARDTASVSISVVAAGNHAPVATIAAPADGTAIFSADSVTFTGSATDVEDGVIGDGHLAWSSSIDGALGTGGSVTTHALSVGVHRITLTATDSGGDSGAASLTLSVLAVNQPPVATISSPADGASFDASQTVQLRGSGQDPEDGALAGQSLSWTSSLDGLLGHGASVDTASLRAGSHTLTLTATDSGGRAASAQVSITVRPAQVNLAPVARLSAPAQGVSGQALLLDGSASSDPDGTIASYRFAFGDGSADQSGASATASHAYAAAGAYTATLTVTDNQGATGTATAGVVISEPVHLPGVVDPGPSLGSLCAIAPLADGSVRVAYRSLLHPALWLATVPASGAPALEQVDGMGYEVGGTVAGSLAMATSADGTPHLAYALENGQLWYATRTGGGWTRERVDTGSARVNVSYGAAVGLALDPAHSNRPTISYTDGYPQVVIAARTGANTWTNTPLVFPNTIYANDSYNQGGLAIDPSGLVYVTFLSDYPYLGSWNGSTAVTFSLPLAAVMHNGNGPIPLSLDGAGKPLAMLGNQLVHVSPGSSGLGNAGSTSSPFEESTIDDGALAVGDQAWMSYSHAGQLELVHAPLDGYFDYKTQLGPLDGAFTSVAVDGAGKPRVCFFRDGKLMLY